MRTRNESRHRHRRRADVLASCHRGICVVVCCSVCIGALLASTRNRSVSIFAHSKVWTCSDHQVIEAHQAATLSCVRRRLPLSTSSGPLGMYCRVLTRVYALIVYARLYYNVTAAVHSYKGKYSVIAILAAFTGITERQFCQMPGTGRR